MKDNIQTSSTSTTGSICDSNPKRWSNLDTHLRSLLLNEEGITYVITDFFSLPKESFLGAPAHAFKSTIRINLSTENDGKKWLERMMKHSMCTYRQSKGRKPGCKRVLYKVEMHCQHKKKPLTQQQREQAATLKSLILVRD